MFYLPLTTNYGEASKVFFLSIGPKGTTGSAGPKGDPGPQGVQGKFTPITGTLTFSKGHTHKTVSTLYIN